MAVRALEALVSVHKSSLVFLSEIKLSYLPKFSKISKYIGFSYFEFIPTIGSSGVIDLLWKMFLDIRVLVSHTNLINALVFSEGYELLR